jgi:hypothetical protein
MISLAVVELVFIGGTAVGVVTTGVTGVTTGAGVVEFEQDESSIGKLTMHKIRERVLRSIFWVFKDIFSILNYLIIANILNIIR